MSQRALCSLRRVVELVDMEAAGIEPASRDISMEASTCVVDSLSFAQGGPYRPGPPGTRWEQFLAASVLTMTDGEPDLTTDFWDSPVKARSRSCLLLGS